MGSAHSNNIQSIYHILYIYIQLYMFYVYNVLYHINSYNIYKIDICYIFICICIHMLLYIYIIVCQIYYRLSYTLNIYIMYLCSFLYDITCISYINKCLYVCMCIFLSLFLYASSFSVDRTSRLSLMISASNRRTKTRNQKTNFRLVSVSVSY